MRGPNGEYYVGYSGAPGLYKNNPDAEDVSFMGPIPRGHWRINFPAYNNLHTGHYTLDLTPVGHNAHGRNNFRIHGESSAHPGASSEGCIILPLVGRQAIVHSGDDTLIVVRD